jgi:hypothetical protein
MDIQEKYKREREFIKNGDIVLFHGESIVSKIISKSDNNAYFTHVEIIFICNERIYVQGSGLFGNAPQLLSHRLSGHTDYEIIRPLKTDEIPNALIKAFTKIESHIKYDYKNGIREMLNRKYKLKLKIVKTENKVCSEFTSPYAVMLDMVTQDFISLEVPLPQDFIRYINTKNAIRLSDIK